VRVKLAASLDGRIALADGASRWITGEAARQDVQRWRARSSALLTGAGTIVHDDPALTVRDTGLDLKGRHPLKVVLAGQRPLPQEARVLSPPGRTLVVVPSPAPGWARALEGRGTRLLVLPHGPGGVDLHALLTALAKEEVNEVLVEAGATLAGQLVRLGLLDELLLYQATILLGPDARELATLPALSSLAASPRFKLTDWRRVGADLRLTLKPEGL
jgi:diaminohydroxyphosphoribosylaminopyrimidine deaminase/5-amino-6-(5-phosphoribosylamino)uracil reductase